MNNTNKTIKDLQYIADVLTSCVSSIKDITLLAKEGKCHIDIKSVSESVALVNKLNQVIIDSINF